jgi:hypothetical protein
MWTRAATIAIVLVVATLSFVGEQWLLLQDPANGIEFGVAVHAVDGENSN